MALRSSGTDAQFLRNMQLMADTEIYVDGIATMQIKNMNDWLDAVRLQIIQQKNPDVKRSRT